MNPFYASERGALHGITADLFCSRKLQKPGASGPVLAHGAT